jgi:hypothetical protein
MKRFKFGIILALAVLLTVTLIGQANAQKPVTRPGSDYNGIAPTDCGIKVHQNAPSELHVGCANATKVARIRYRFTPGHGYNGQFKPAHVEVDWSCHGKQSKCDKPGAVQVSWRVHIPRTLRVVVRGAYVHIESVTWSQP